MLDSNSMTRWCAGGAPEAGAGVTNAAARLAILNPRILRLALGLAQGRSIQYIFSKLSRVAIIMIFKLPDYAESLLC